MVLLQRPKYVAVADELSTVSVPGNIVPIDPHGDRQTRMRRLHAEAQSARRRAEDARAAWCAAQAKFAGEVDSTRPISELRGCLQELRAAGASYRAAQARAERIGQLLANATAFPPGVADATAVPQGHGSFDDHR